MGRLKKFCQVLTFTDWQKASVEIYEAKAACHVITSGTNGELFVREISSSPNVEHIYVFCKSKDYHSNWAKNHPKISCVETNIENVLNKIQDNLLEWYKRESSLKLNLPAFAPIFNDSDKSQMNRLHYFLKVIPNFRSRKQAKDDFVALSESIYSDSTNKQEITHFEKDYNGYNKEKILRWYTRDTFLYRVTNNCLRKATSDHIQSCRLLLKDLETAIKEQYQTKSKDFSGLLERGAYLSEEEWSSLKENKGREIEMLGFLSASKLEKVALNFMKKDPNKKAFITIIVPKGLNEEEQGFAEVEDYSLFPLEKEILFNVRSRFTVLETEEKYSPQLPYRHLVLFYGAQRFRKFMTEQNPVKQVTIKDLKSICCCQCNQTSGEVLFMPVVDIQKPTFYCKKCLDSATAAPFLYVPPITKNQATFSIKGFLLTNSNQKGTPFYGYECSKCHLKKQRKYFICTDCDKKWCEDCFENDLNCIQAKHSIILEMTSFSFWCEKMTENELNHLKFENDLVTKNDNEFQQAEMYFESHEYEKAIEYCTLYIQQNKVKGKDSRLATSYNIRGLVYKEKAEYKQALEDTLESLSIRRSLYGEKHPDVATSIHNLGSVYECKGEYRKALEYYLKALDIRKSVSGEKNTETAGCYMNLGQIYVDLEEYKTALKYYFQALEIYKSVHGENHPDVAKLYAHLGNAENRQGNFKNGLEYHFKALDIRKSLYGENHPSVATSYDNMGVIYDNQGEYERALEYASKSLHIRKLVYGENHPDIGVNYNHFANAYADQGNFKKALEYYLKYLEIIKSVYGEIHPYVAIAYNNIGSVYQHQKEYKEALECGLKSLNIKIAVYGENHSDVAIAYNNIGDVYEDQGEHKEALKYYFKALEMTKAIYGEKFHVVAVIYYNIGETYENQKEYEKALEYCLKALDIFKSIHGENHPHVAHCYNKVGSVYSLHGENEKAQECFLKSLEIFKPGGSEENLPIIAASYSGLGSVFESQREYEKAKEYFLQALDIFSSAFGEEHHETKSVSSKIETIMRIIENQRC